MTCFPQIRSYVKRNDQMLVIFHQDNAPVKLAKITKTWLKLRTSPSGSCFGLVSPDLNHIVNIRSHNKLMNFSTTHEQFD